MREIIYCQLYTSSPFLQLILELTKSIQSRLTSVLQLPHLNLASNSQMSSQNDLMSAKLEKIVEELSTLSVLEASELSKLLEDLNLIGDIQSTSNKVSYYYQDNFYQNILPD